MIVRITTLAALGLWVSVAQAERTTFKVVSAKARAGTVEIKVNWQHFGSKQVGKFYAHAQPPEHYVSEVEKGVKLGNVPMSEGNGSHRFSISAARLAKRGIVPGKKIAIAAHWAPGLHHRWGTTCWNTDGTYVQLKGQACEVRASAPGRRLVNRFKVEKMTVAKDGKTATVWLSYVQSPAGKHNDGSGVQFFAQSALDGKTTVPLGKRNLVAGSKQQVRFRVPLDQLNLKPGDPIYLSALWKSGYERKPSMRDSQAVLPPPNKR
ncbi:MAG: hypothetical protein H6707_11155 [Deltaproteobacteria bacterium]|nr:hypothetical protein [Deltaproteobacteria bacterium]